MAVTLPLKLLSARLALLVDSIKSAGIEIDVTGATSNVSGNADIHFYDAEGELGGAQLLYDIPGRLHGDPDPVRALQHLIEFIALFQQLRVDQIHLG